ncbi:MAG: hypothetical protein MUF71_08880 [Candidatus Kapabacteria bacterium]|nr:hypothetical protein [Candidatus Kapabacteria bacterium]
MRLHIRFCAVLLVMAFPLKSSSQQTFFLDTISDEYDVKFTIPCKNYACEGDGIITLLRKNTDSVAFQFSVKNCAFVLRKPHDSSLKHITAENGEGLHTYQPPIVCNDFDFDGNDDFAIPIRNPHKHSKNKATFDIFLFDVAEQRFTLHKKLTAIQHSTSTVLDVDIVRKKVNCYRQYDPRLETVKEYTWVGTGAQKQLQIVLDWQNDTSKIHPVVTKTTYTFVKGTWVKKTVRRVKFRNDCE